MRILSLIALLALAGCNVDVPLGQNLAVAGLADAGLDGGADADAGLDVGADGGPGPDAGASGDAGLSDAGLPDGGPGLDAGLSDAGPGVDAGQDAGQAPADLALSLSGPLAVEQLDTADWEVRARNLGALSALGASATVTLPGGLTFAGSPGCVEQDAGVLRCALGDVAGGGVGTASFTLAATLVRGFHDFSAQVSTTSVDADATNDRAVGALATTDVGSLAVGLTTPVTLDVSGCRGTNITSYAQCTPGSLILEQYTLFPDGGLMETSGVTGLWAQSSHRRNLVMRFVLPSGQFLGGFAGVAVSATCFEGVVDQPPDREVGAWRACLP